MKLRAARARILSSGLVAVATALTSAVVGVAAAPAGAAPSTKYYLSTATPTSFDVSPDAPTSPNVTFTLTNCGYGITDCSKGSTQSWGSAHVTLPATVPPLPTRWDWGTASGLTVYATDGSISKTKTAKWTVSQSTDSAGNVVVELGNDGTGSTYAIAPGEKLTFTASLTPSPAGLAAVTTEVKQSNDFSGTGNNFLHGGTNTDPTIIIGPPHHLLFSFPPQAVQVTTSSTDTHYMCDDNDHGPTVQVVDKDNHLVTWVPSLAVTLSSTQDPGLKYKATSTSTATKTLTESTVGGVATFGSACATGLTASTPGGYLMSASASFGTTPLTVPDPAPFDVLPYVQPCGQSCSTPTIGKGHTTVSVQGNGLTTNHLGVSVGILADLGNCTPEASNPDRQVVSVDLNNHTKQITLSWDKQTVQIFTNNGTPFWNVCIWTTYSFTIAGGGPATSFTVPPDPTVWYTGFLANCGVVDPTVNPCITDLYRRGGAEFANISLPNVPGDPHFI